jgi:tetratricopeptide (TPR) repeat protein
MNRTSRTAAFLIAMLGPCSIGVGPATAFDLPATATGDAWFRASTEHFVVFSSAGGDAAADVARRLERLSDVLARTNQVLETPTRLPTWVYVFADEAGFRAYRPRDFENVGGVFHPAPDRNLIAFAHGSGALATEVLYHEYTHCYLRGKLPSLPTWLNEGMAEYYSTFDPSGDLSAEIGKPRAGYAEWFRAHPLMPLEELFPIEASSEDYHRNSDRRLTFYAESWALVHFMLHGPPDRARHFADYLGRLRRGEPAADAFEAEFPRAEWATLLGQLRDYLAADKFEVQHFDFSYGFATYDVRVEAMSRTEVLTRLGELAADLSDDTKLAADHFHAALAEDPHDAEALASLGWMLDEGGDAVQADRYYAEAIDAPSFAARPWAIAGRGALRRYHPSVDAAPDSVPPIVREARRRFRRCLELEPGNLEALAGYGKSWIYDPVPAADAVQALRTASSALPARTDIALDLMVLLARSGRMDEARGILADLSPRLSEKSRSVAQRWLDRAGGAGADDPREAHPRSGPPADAAEAYAQGLEAAGHGRYREGWTLFMRAMTGSADGALVKNAAAQARLMQARFHVQEGLAHLSAGRLEAARAPLTRALNEDERPSFQGYVRRLLAETEARPASRR